MALDEPLERLQVAAERSAHEGLIGIGEHGGCDLPARGGLQVFGWSVRVQPP
ncbi:MAG: hypothetical protein ABI611_08565 [Solirubrobacteraceae bacterium]